MDLEMDKGQEAGLGVGYRREQGVVAGIHKNSVKTLKIELFIMSMEKMEEEHCYSPQHKNLGCGP